MPKNVVVGLSGGVDSSVAAALLKARGFEVIGAFLVNWTTALPGCRSTELDLEDARRVAAILDIPLYTFNLEKAYFERVIAPTIASFRRGETPNPDVLCNREIKFGLFRQLAFRLGGEFLATGHYARLEHHSPPHLFQARDGTKDQSYFLAGLGREQLTNVLLPLGELTKKEVRKIALSLGLPTATKPDSTGICFVGEVDLKTFLSRWLPPKPGPILDCDGRTLGQHDGAWFYTIGQRCPLPSLGTPHYILEKDVGQNTVVVAPKDHPAHFCRAIVAADLTFLHKPPSSPFRCLVRFRHLQPFLTARLTLHERCVVVELDQPQRGIAPGQVLALYSERGELLGGGPIVASERLSGQNTAFRNSTPRASL